MLALLVSCYGIVAALVLTKWAPGRAFEFILRAAFFGMILSWVVSLGAHVVFRSRLSPQQIAAMPMRSPLGRWGSIIGFCTICAVTLKGWYDSRVNLISGVALLIVLTGLYFVLSPKKDSPSALQ